MLLLSAAQGNREGKIQKHSENVFSHGIRPRTAEAVQNLQDMVSIETVFPKSQK